MIFADGGEGYLRTAYDDAWVERELGVAQRRTGPASREPRASEPPA